MSYVSIMYTHKYKIYEIFSSPSLFVVFSTFVFGQSYKLILWTVCFCDAATQQYHYSKVNTPLCTVTVKAMEV